VTMGWVRPHVGSWGWSMRGRHDQSTRDESGVGVRGCGVGGTHTICGARDWLDQSLGWLV
jgi:hypothetical protein